MEPLMLITLLAIGLAVFFAIQAAGARKRVSSEDKVLKGYFLLGLSGLMAKIAMADGRVTGDEAEMAKFREEQAAKDAEREAKAAEEKAQRDADREEQRQQLLAIQEELRKSREAAAKAKNEAMEGAENENDNVE